MIGSNIVLPPKTALAFTIQNYLIWQVSLVSPTVYTTQVIDNIDFSNLNWGNPNLAVGAVSLIDGVANTLYIVQNEPSGTASAGAACYNSTNGGASPGQWYLPAVCQLGGSNPNVSCGDLANINSNLVLKKDFGNLSSPNNPEQSTYYWSSTEVSGQEATKAWFVSFKHKFSPQLPGAKFATVLARCARTMDVPP